MNLARWLSLGGVALGVLFAVQGGEYGTLDYYDLRHQERELQAEVAELRETVDSLDTVAVALERDPQVQERVAREAYGMLRRGEFLYRLVPDQGDGPEPRSAAP